jgi:hypothetical protein
MDINAAINRIGLLVVVREETGKTYGFWEDVWDGANAQQKADWDDKHRNIISDIQVFGQIF